MLSLLVATLVALSGSGHFDDVTYRTERRNVTVSAGVYGLGPSHEVTGSFVGGSRYFNSDGVFAPSGRIDCPGYRYEVRSLRGVSRIKVRIPSRCVGDDLNRNVLVRLIMLDPSEPGRGIYLQLDTREVVSCSSSRPVRCP